MKNIRTYNTFINESLRNKLKGKSEDEIDKIINYDRPRDSFYLSIRYGYMKGVKISLSKFDNDLSVDRLNSGLDIAVGYNQFHIAKLLIDLGADASNTEYYDMLVNATIQRNYDMVKLLIDNGTDPVDEEWENALYNAAHNNDIDIVKLLLKHSKGKDIVSSNLINDIKRKGYNDIHKLLIRFNALPTNESLKDKIKGKTDDEIKNKLKDLTPKEQLRLAVKYNYLDIIKNIHTLPSFNKLTLKNSLIESIGLDHYEIAKYLFDIGVPLDVKDYNDPLNYF